jgi:multidrug efflux pump subunit AcrA (membrane-fusion protein)
MNEATAPRQDRGTPTGIFFGVLAACLVLAIVIIVLGVRVHSLNAQLPDAQAQLTSAKVETAQAQAELATAKAATGVLQTQLEKAKAASGDLQAQLDKAKGQQADLLAQLDKAKADKAKAADLQLQLDGAKAQSADLQGQLNKAAAGSAQMLAQLDQAKSQSLDLQSRLQKAEDALAKLQPLVLKARVMPVTTSFESGSWGSSFGMHNGVTLRVNNVSPQPLKVDISITGQGKTRTQSNVIEVRATLAVEKLAAGESVVIASEGYDPVRLTVQ